MIFLLSNEITFRRKTARIITLIAPKAAPAKIPLPHLRTRAGCPPFTGVSRGDCVSRKRLDATHNLPVNLEMICRPRNTYFWVFFACRLVILNEIMV